MELKIELVGAEADEQALRSLEGWLRDSEIDGLAVERQKARPGEEEMGDWVAILSVVLGSSAVVELVRTLGPWLKSRRRNLSLEIVVDGKVVKLQAENLASDEAVIQTAETIVKATTNRS